MLSNFGDMNIITRLKYDAITGFYTRTYYELELLDILRKNTSKNLICMFADFNFLKYANDMYGYSNVDEALKKISKLVLEEVEKSLKEYYIVRFGGDELCIFGKSTDFQTVGNLKLKIQQRIKDMNGECLNLSLAIGYSYYDKNEGFENLLSEAKINMSKDKEHLKAKSAVNVEKAVELLVPTIERMVAEKDYQEFMFLLERKLISEIKDLK